MVEVQVASVRCPICGKVLIGASYREAYSKLISHYAGKHREREAPPLEHFK